MFKKRSRRGDPPLSDAAVVIRADLLDPGMAPHYDLVHDDLSELVVRMLATTHRVLENPHYDSGGER